MPDDLDVLEIISEGASSTTVTTVVPLQLDIFLS